MSRMDAAALIARVGTTGALHVNVFICPWHPNQLLSQMHQLALTFA